MDDDEFLREWAQPPRPEFVQALHERLKQVPERREQRWLGPGILFFLLGLGIMACAVPQLRTPILQAIQTPLAQVRGEQTVAVFRTTGQAGEQENPAPLPVQMEYLSFEEIEAKVPVSVHLPTWMPAGLEPAEAMLFTSPGAVTLLSLGWEKEGEGFPLRLDIWWPAGRITLPVQETIEVNGQPAMWVEEPRAPGYVSLTWIQQEEGVAYVLTANREQISKEDMLRIAATMR